MENAKRILVPLSRIALGVLFLVAGVQKVGSPELFAREIAAYGLLPSQLTSLSALVVPWLEILAGAFLLVGWLSRAAAVISSAMSFAFLVFVSSALLRGLDVNCGCFSQSSKVSWGHAGLDLLMLLASLGILLVGPGTPSLDEKWNSNEGPPPTPKIAIAFGALLAVLNLSVIAYRGLPQLQIESPSVSVQGSAELTFTPPVGDLGLVRQEDIVELSVLIENIGIEEAVITQIGTTCGCTEAKIEKSTLLPGESSVLRVTYHDAKNVGVIAQTVRLFVQGQEEPTVLPITGEIDPTVKAAPELAKLQDGDTVVFELKSRREGYTPRVSGLSTPIKTLKIDSIETSKDGNPRVKLRLDGPFPKPPGQATAWPVQILLEGAPPCIVFLMGVSP